MDLFMAIPYQKKLDSCNPKLLELLELETFETAGKSFIGKKVKSYPTLEELTDLEAHLSSVLKRLQLDDQEARLVSVFNQ